MKTRAFLLALVLSGNAYGQSTSALGSAERKTTLQISIGGDAHLLPMGYSRDTRSRVIDVSVHRELEGRMTLRFDGWLIDRPSYGEQDPSSSRTYSYDPIRNQSYETIQRSARFAAVVASGSFPVHLGGGIVAAPTVGLGLVPTARGRFTEVTTTQNATPTSRSISVSSHGVVWAFGLGVRWRHLVLEHHILQVTGADGALTNGEGAPLTVGWRF
jgi:hypothetical protein